MKKVFEGQTVIETRVYDNGITIMLRLHEKVWEVYYETDGFPLSFGFGLPYDKTTKSQAWGYAEANAHQVCMAIFLS